jgi:hypothetical protein
MIETLGQIPAQLEVLALVVAHRHGIGVVEHDVGRHQNRIHEQARVDRGLARAPS